MDWLKGIMSWALVIIYALVVDGGAERRTI